MHYKSTLLSLNHAVTTNFYQTLNYKIKSIVIVVIKNNLFCRFKKLIDLNINFFFNFNIMHCQHHCSFTNYTKVKNGFLFCTDKKNVFLIVRKVYLLNER